MTRPRCILRGTIAVLCAALWTLRASAASVDAPQQLAEASALESRGEHAAAAEKYTVLITEAGLPAPTRRLAHIGRGVAFGNQANFTAAINDFTAAIALDASLSDGYYDRALVYSDVGRYPEALADLNVIAAAANSYPKYFYYRGYVHFENDEFQNAVTDFDRALLSMPNSPDVYYRRGKAFASLDMRERALQDFEATTRLKPVPEMLAAAHRWHGTEALALKRYAVAEQDFAVILRDDPQDADARMRRALACARQKKFVKAIEDYGQVIRSGVRSPVFPWPGIVNAEQILADRIIDQYNAGVRTPGIDPYAYVLRARAYHEMGNDRSAVSDYQAAIAVIPAGVDDSVAGEMAGLPRRAP